jgi:uncharacterized damage-inducible protein DinB
MNAPALKSYQMLARYKAWADELLYATVGKVPKAELVKPQKIVFGSLLRTLNHVHAMDLVWRSHLQGVPHGLTSRNPADCPPLAELSTAQRTMDEWFIRYADGVADSAMEEIVEFEYIGGGRGAMSRHEMLIHVVNHGTYHRGHIGDMLYQISVEPPTTDFPVWVRETRSP